MHEEKVRLCKKEQRNHSGGKRKKKFVSLRGRESEEAEECVNNLIQPKTTRLPLFNGERFLDLKPDMLVLAELLQQSGQHLFRWKNKGFNSISENCSVKWCIL